MRDATSIAAAADRVRQEVGVLDVLVNNAGIAGDQRPPRAASNDDLMGWARAKSICACHPARGSSRPDQGAGHGL